MMTNRDTPPTAARLTTGFLDRVAATGLTDAATAAAIGVNPQQYSAIKRGIEQPTTRFIVGAVTAGLAETFGDVAEVVDVASAKSARAAA